MFVKINKRLALSLSKGFSLIELLVVISIIGVLVSFGAARYQVSEKQARDTERKSDLNQYRIALENYSSANNSLYPIAECGNISNLCSFENFAATYLSGQCIVDPRESDTLFYSYCSDGEKYAIWTTLESGGYYEVCSNGKSGRLSTAPDSSGGNCSL